MEKMHRQVMGEEAQSFHAPSRHVAVSVTSHGQQQRSSLDPFG